VVSPHYTFDVGRNLTFFIAIVTWVLFANRCASLIEFLTVKLKVTLRSGYRKFTFRQIARSAIPAL